jgi:serine protease Do
MNKGSLRSLLGVFLFIFGSWLSVANATLPLDVTSKTTPSLAQTLKKVMPAVVNIYVQGQLPPGHYGNGGSNNRPYPVVTAPKFQDVGSGVIVDAKLGLIVTNAHVVRDSQSITVTLNDGRRFKGRLIGADNASDIAVVKINANDLSAIPFADSDKVQVGDFVAAIGSPFGLLTQTVTSGVVSALNRSDLGIEGYENFIQTDAPINPGNSGGALVDMKGELIGINTAIIAPAGGNVGIGFAIPSNMVRSVMDQLIQYGKVERGLLGVMVQNLTPELADALNEHGVKGALITQVSPGSPADKSGLQIKDIVDQINGKPIINAAQLRNAVGLVRVGTKLNLHVLRGNKTLNIQATVVSPKEAFTPANNVPSFLAGVRLRDFDQLDFNAREVKGVQVLDLDDNSAAALKGLRPGDVILTANNQLVTSLQQLLQAANSNPKRLLLEIARSSGGRVFLVIDNN